MEIDMYFIARYVDQMTSKTQPYKWDYNLTFALGSSIAVGGVSKPVTGKLDKP